MKYFVYIMMIFLFGCTENNIFFHNDIENNHIKFYVWADKFNSNGNIMFASIIDKKCLKNPKFFNGTVYVVYFDNKNIPKQMDELKRKKIVRSYFFDKEGRITKSINFIKKNICRYNILKTKKQSRIIRVCEDGQKTIYLYQRDKLIQSSFISKDNNETIIIKGDRYKLYRNGKFIENGRYIPIEESIPVSPRC